MDHNSTGTTDTAILSVFFAILSWVTIKDVQAFVSISAGVIACIAGVTTIIKNRKK